MKRESLHELIHSLTKSEKRYFKVFAGVDGSGKQQRYIQLFDLLSEMEIFDPERVQATMQWGNFKPAYAMAKRYLYDKILQSLSAFEKADTVTAQMVTKIEQIRILMKKGLEQQAFGKIRKARRAAFQAESWNRLLELLGEERRLLVRSKEKVFDPNSLFKLNQEIEYAIRGITLVQKVKEYHYRLFSTIREHGGLMGTEARNKADQLIEELMDLRVLEQPFLTARIHHYNVLNQYHFLLKNNRESQKMLTNILEIFEANPPILEEYKDNYLANLHNLCNRSFLTSDYELSMQILYTLQDFRSRNSIVHTLWLESYYSLGITMVLNSGQVVENPSFLAEVLQLVENPSPRIGREFLIRMRLGLAATFFMVEEWELSLKHFQAVLMDPSHAPMHSVDRLVPIMEILVHQELGNTDWLEYRVRSYLKSGGAKSAYAFEKIFKKFLKRSLQVMGRTEFRALAGELKRDIQGLQNDVQSTNLFKLFDFETWADAKSQGKTFLEALHIQWAKKSDVLVRLKGRGKGQ